MLFSPFKPHESYAKSIKYKINIRQLDLFVNEKGGLGKGILQILRKLEESGLKLLFRRKKTFRFYASLFDNMGGK